MTSYDFLEIDRIVAEMYPGKRVSIEPYSYGFDIAATVAATEAFAELTINSNVDFLWIDTVAGDLTQGVNSTADVFNIRDQGSGAYFFNRSIALLGFVEECSSPQFALNSGVPMPRKISGNSTLQLSVTATAPLENFQFILKGVHVYVYD